MSGRRARSIRRQVYGGDGVPKSGAYVKHPEKGVVLADMRRNDYQKSKRAWYERKH